MIVLQAFLWILFALVLLICLLLWLKITVRLKYGEQKAVIIGIGFVRINLTKLRERREKRKKKPKIQRLSKTLPKELPEPADETDIKDKFVSQSTAAPQATKFSVSEPTDATADNKTVETKNQKNKQSESNSFAQTAKNAHGQKDGGIGKMLSDFIKGKSIKQNLSLLKEILMQTSEKFSRHAKLKVKKLKVIVSCPDAADTAVLFGIANGAVCSIVGIIESFSVFSVEKGAVGVYQDYVSGKSSFEADISFSMRVFQILLCTLPALRTFIRIKTTKSSPKE